MQKQYPSAVASTAFRKDYYHPSRTNLFTTTTPPPTPSTVTQGSNPSGSSNDSGKSSGEKDWAWPKWLTISRVAGGLGLLYFASRIFRMTSFDGENVELDLFGKSTKNIRKPKYVLKIQPLEETISQYNASFADAQQPLAILQSREGKAALKYRKIRQQLCANRVRIIILRVPK